MSTTPPTAQRGLMELVRSADPLDGDVDPMAAEAAETLLREILAAPHPEQRPSGRRRGTTVVRLAAVGAAAAVALVAANALLGDDRGGATPASAAVIRHALAALDQAPDTILHVDLTGTQDNGDGTTVTWHEESWQEHDAPYDRRQLETNPDGIIAESANVGDDEQVYDPATNTIYTSTSAGGSTATHQPLRLSPGPTAGTYLLRPTMYRIGPGGHAAKIIAGPRSEGVVITASQLKALRAGTDTLAWRRRESRGGHRRFRFKLAVVPVPTAATKPDDPDPSSQEFSDQILTLLQSGGAHLVGPATVAGRDTLEIRSQDGHTTYYVDPTTYAPVELDTTGTSGGVSLLFNTWDVLPADDATEALLSLTAQHPSATVDRDPAHYDAAERRLFPNG
jgi:hypothetical protein